jgi:uncharacterized protein YciI
MPYFALTYEVVDNYVEKRAPFRDEHLRLAQAARARGDLLMAGALGEPAGALLVFKTADRTSAEEFARNDPYVLNGLVSKWQVRPWTVVISDDPADQPR